MKRAPSEDLFRLIKSLHKGEKRNFKLLAGSMAGDRNKKYIELFDMIDRQDTYNEAKLVKHFADLYGGQLSAGKNYLHKMILKSLVHYNSGAGAEVKHLTEQVRILIGKELYGQARKILRKAIREATQLEQFADHHELLGMEMAALLQQQNERKLGAQIMHLAEEKQVLLRKIQNLDAYEALAARLYVFMNNRHVARKEEDMVEFREISEHPLLLGPEAVLSVRARVHFLALQAKLHSFRGDLSQAAACSKDLIQVLEDAPQIRDSMLHRYFLEISNLALYQLRGGAYKAADETLDRFQELRAAYPKARANFFPLYFIAKITLGVHLGEIEQEGGILAEIEAEFETIQAHSPGWHEMLLSYLVAYHYNIHGRSSDALRWINLIINAPRSDQRIYLQCFAKLLFLMIHFDLENYMVVESGLPNVQRFLEKHDNLHRYEESVLRALRAMTKSVGTPEGREVLSHHLSEFTTLAEDRFEGRAVALLDVGQWLESKLRKTTMAQLRSSKNA